MQHQTTLADSLRFLKALITRPKSIGAVLPSSPALGAAMARQITTDGPVLELGPGTGAITTEILAHGVAPQDLTCVEYDGGFARHLRKMRAVYQGRHALITSTLRREFQDILEIVPSAAGLHVAAFVRDEFGAALDEVAECANARGVAVMQLARTRSLDRPGLMLGFGAIATDRIEEGLRRLRQCFAQASTQA